VKEKLGERRPAAASMDGGLLEGLLASLRARKADSLLPGALRAGRVLDVGCGRRLSFLVRSRFATKVGVDRPERSARGPGVHCVGVDLEHVTSLPFRDGSFSTVSMLAVIEHLRPEAAQRVLRDVRRVLEEDGALVITTPLPWTDTLLTAMARIGLLSRGQIGDHERTYALRELRHLCRDAGFDPDRIRVGRFEFGANAWLLARK